MRRLPMLGTVLVVFVTTVAAQERAKDTPKAAEARKRLQQKISVDYAGMPLRDVRQDLNDQVKGLGLRLDTKGGVSQNIRITYKADNKTVADVLDAIFTKNALGYIVISKEGDAYDGTILVRQGKERGFATGDDAEMPDKEKAVAEKPDKAKPEKTGKAKTEPKDDVKEKAPPKEKEEAKDDPEKLEKDAARKYGFAKTLADDGKTARAKERLEELIKAYPGTKAAAQAEELLKKLNK